MKTYSLLPQVLVALSAYGGAFIFGVSLGWSSPAAPKLLSSENPNFSVTSSELAWIVAMMALGASVATAISGVLRNKFGTKTTVAIIGIPTTIGWLLIIFGQSALTIMIGRFFSGFAAGSYGILLPLYIGEIASKEIRGSLLSLFQIILNFGEIFVFTLGYFVDLLTLNIVCGMIPIVYCFVFMKLPESPVFLVTKNRDSEAHAVIQKLKGKNFECDEEINDIKKYHQMNSSDFSFIDHMKHTATRKAFLIIMTQFFFFQFTGINAVLFYTSTIFLEANIKLDAGIASIIVVSSQIVGTSFSTVLVDRFGRRLMLMVSTVLMALSHVSIGVYFQLKDSGASVDGLSWLPIVSLSIFEVAFGSGMGPVSYVLLGELFTPNAKRIIAPIGKSFNLFLGAVVGLTFPFLVNTIGNSSTFFVFSGFSVLALIFTCFSIPETKGRSLIEIQDLLK